MSNQFLTLDRDALYIETQSLHQEGKYHWALLFVNPSGIATRIQWPKISPCSSPLPASTSGHSRPSTPPEPYLTVSVPMVSPLSQTGAGHVLGYCKIAAYVGGMAQRVFEEAGAAAFREGCDNMRVGRPTWLFHVLGVLQERGYIMREGPAAALEEVVCKMNRDADMRYLQAFLRSAQYRMYITTV